MINAIESADQGNNNRQDQKSSVLTTLQNENTISFDGDKVKFPETELTNIQEALAYIRKQEHLLLQKNREHNENVVKEVSEILDNVQNKWFLDEYSGDKFFHEKQTIKEIKDFLKNYEWDLSNFMNEVAVEWQKRLQIFSWRGDLPQEFLARWHISADVFNQLEWEDLIKALKKDADNIDNLPKATVSNFTNQDLATANFIYFVFKSIYEKYQKQQNPLK